MKPSQITCNCCKKNAVELKERNVRNSTRGLYTILLRVKQYYYVCERCVATNVLATDHSGEGALVYNVTKKQYEASSDLLAYYEGEIVLELNSEAGSIYEVIENVKDEQNSLLERARAKRQADMELPSFEELPELSAHTETTLEELNPVLTDTGSLKALVNSQKQAIEEPLIMRVDTNEIASDMVHNDIPMRELSEVTPLDTTSLPEPHEFDFADDRGLSLESLIRKFNA